jgi:uncharacterized protein YecE (DUF72 family)
VVALSRVSARISPLTATADVDSDSPTTPRLHGDFVVTQTAVRLRAGTSGYSYKEWKGPFYPEKLKPADMLGFYAERLSTVEINNTFYRMPKTSVLENWAEQVGDDFRFAIKASRRITHFKRLKEADEPLEFLVENLKVLGDRLGVVLFQLPPNMKCDVERLDRFCDLLPAGFPAAFEFRHDSWQDDAVHDRLRAHNFATVIVDADDADHGDDDVDDADEVGPPELFATADWGYLRLRRPDYDRAALANWAREISSQGWNHSFVYFKHEDDGAGPRMAREFLEAAAETRAPRRVAASTRRSEQPQKKAAS